MKTPQAKRGILWLAPIFCSLILMIVAGDRATAQTNTFPSSGNAGVGTPTPSVKLEVISSVTAGTGTARFKNTGANTQVVLDSDASQNTNLRFDANAAPAWYFGNEASNSRFRLINSNANGNVEVFSILQGGNVGIGTSNPATKLEISAASPMIQMSDTLSTKMTLGTFGQWSGFSPNRNLVTGSHFDTGKTTAGYFMFVGNGNSFHWWGTTPTNNAEPIERMRLDKDGNLGIGTSSPTVANGYTALSLNNSTGTLVDFMTNNALKARLQSDGTTFYFNNLANGPIQIYTNNAERMRIDAGGKIGIGTTAPIYSLDVSGGVNSFRAKAASALSTDTIATFENNSAIKMIVRANGNVGIGTTAPAKTLDVTGDINASGTITGGNIQARYQDVAEWVESSQKLPSGTVVILDPTKSNHVIASMHPYDSRVAGVISGQPGIALGEQSEGRLLVATTGRVKVKVDASAGPIQIGDLLVTSDKAGIAMKSVPVEIGGIRIHRPGTLIGKALEPLPNGEGTILVLLSLQ